MQMQADAGRLHVSVVTVAEIQRGTRKLMRAGGTARAQALSEWLQSLVEVYGDRILPIDTDVAMIAGVIEDHATAAGKNPGFADVLIAATAKAHGLAVLTANVRHFQPLDVNCFNPEDGRPED
jgi:predicted nucleic acid-binding protein